MATFSGLVYWLRPSADALLALSNVARVTSVRRSRRQQARLYRRFLAGQSRFPAAPPGQSLHEQGRAFDIYADDETLRRLGAIWERAGGTWGGRFGDPIHFEG